MTDQLIRIPNAGSLMSGVTLRSILPKPMKFALVDKMPNFPNGVCYIKHDHNNSETMFAGRPNPKSKKEYVLYSTDFENHREVVRALSEHTYIVFERNRHTEEMFDLLNVRGDTLLYSVIGYRQGKRDLEEFKYDGVKLAQIKHRMVDASILTEDTHNEERTPMTKKIDESIIDKIENFIKEDVKDSVTRGGTKRFILDEKKEWKKPKKGVNPFPEHSFEKGENSQEDKEENDKKEEKAKKDKKAKSKK